MINIDKNLSNQLHGESAASDWLMNLLQLDTRNHFVDEMTPTKWELMSLLRFIKVDYRSGRMFNE